MAVRLEILPAYSCVDFPDRCIADTKIIGNAQHGFSVRKSLANAWYLRFGQLCAMTSRTVKNETQLGRMSGVFFPGDILKIIGSIVLLVAVLMISSQSFWHWADKGIADEGVNRSVLPAAASLQKHGEIAVSVGSRLHDQPGMLGSERGIAADLAETRHAINSFPSNDDTPFFWEKNRIRVSHDLTLHDRVDCGEGQRCVTSTRCTVLFYSIHQTCKGAW